MRILSIELENIKSYDYARVEFTEGVNAIVGHNGAGKSTLLEAVGFTLFSSLDYAQGAFLREGAKQGSVTVAFESKADDRVYEVVRRIGGAGIKQVVHDPELGTSPAEGGPDVERFLRVHMGLQPNADLARIFRDAVGVPQGTLTAAFQLTAANRKAVFDSLLQVEEYKNAWERLREPLNVLEDRSSQVAQVIARLEGMLEALPALTARAGANSAELATTAAALATARDGLSRVQAELVALEEKRVTLQAADRARESARAALASALAALQVAQVHLQEAQDARAIVAAHQLGHDLYLDAQRARGELDRRRQEREQLQLARGNSAAALSLADQQAQQAAEELARIDTAEARVAALAVASAHQVALEERRAVAQAQQGELKGAQSAEQQAGRSLVQEQKTLETMQAALQSLPVAKAALAGSEAAIEVATKRRDELNEVRNAKRAEGLACKTQNEKLMEVHGATCPVCARELTQAHREELLARNIAEMDRLRVELGEANANVAARQAEIDALDAQRRNQEAALHKLPSAQAVAEQAARVADLHAQREAAQARCNALATAPETLRAIEAELEQMGNPRQLSAIARATAEKRPVVESAQQLAVASAATASAALAEVDGALAAYAGLDAELAELQRALEENLAAYQFVLANKQSAATVVARAAAVDAAAVQGEHLQAALAQAESAVAAAAGDFDALAYAHAQAESARLHGVVGSLSSTEAMLAKEGASLARDIGVLRAEEAKLAKARADLHALQAQYKTLKQLRDVIKQAGPYVTAHMIQQVSMSAAQIFGELTGDFSRVLRWGEDYAVTLEVDGRKREFQSLSGGEQMVAALAVRLALLKTISGISVAFFDEPTANLDGQRREALAGQIVSFKGLRQLFVISHDDTFEYATSNTIHLARVDGVSKVLDGGVRGLARTAEDELE